MTTTADAVRLLMRKNLNKFSILFQRPSLAT
ncbi:Uncharacterised protein [Vibrio cholerae]|nr:Uncharacterised protein [Vibrio cholerae]